MRVGESDKESILSAEVVFHREFVLIKEKLFEIADVVLFKKKKNRLFVFRLISVSVRKRAGAGGQQNSVA